MRSEGAAQEASRQKLPLQVRTKYSWVSVFVSLPVEIFGVATPKAEVGVLEVGSG